MVGLAAPAPAQAPDAPRIDQRQADLERIRDQVAGLESRLRRLRERETGLAGELSRTEVELELAAKRLEETRAERALAEAELAVTVARVERIEARLLASRRELRRRLSDLYRLGRHGALRMLLSIRSERHLLPGIRLLRYIVRRESATLSDYLDQRVRLDFERDERVERAERVERLLAAEGARVADLERTRRRQSRLLAAAAREARSVAGERDRLADKERKLANLVDFLYGRNPTALSGTPLQSFQGALDWPAAGRVLEGFGPRLDPRYGTRVPHNGIDISTTPGTGVRAIFPGKVLYAAPFSGFGLTAVINHPRRVLTLYAGLERLRAARGDMVDLGDLVGEAGERLYFEIRVENEPVDPADWLR